MARYSNGTIPKSALVHLGGDHWLTPGTKVRWERLVADVLKNEGVRLQITEGPNAYRDIEWQRYYWNTLPYPQAAYPGTSSHGGEYNGRDSMAIDVSNWAVLGKAKFYAYCRKHGFEPNFFDWEPWHIIDWSPWSVPPKPTIIQELTDMDKAQIIHLFTKGRKDWALIGATVPGGVRTTTSQETVNAWALIYGPSKDAGDQIKYDTAIAEARALAASWLDQQKRINGTAN